MFTRTVTIDGTEVVVPCIPSTPYSEVLIRAAAILKREESGFTAYSEADVVEWAAFRERAEAMV